jgi:hypothetical protein
MPILESTDANHKESGVQSHVAAFFEDAYKDHKVAGATMAVGMLAITKGKSGAGLAAELAEGAAVKGATRLTEAVVESAGAKLASEAMAHPGTMRHLLITGASHVEAPAARNMVMQIDMGLPRAMDAATTAKLAEGVVAKDSAAVTSVMDDIFGGNTYAAMHRRFGG